MPLTACRASRWLLMTILFLWGSAVAADDDTHLAEWIQEQRLRVLKESASDARYARYEEIALAQIMSHDQRLAPVVLLRDSDLHEGWLYNLGDEDDRRQLWRRAKWHQYRATGAAPAWEVLIDSETLGRVPNEGWTLQRLPVCFGARCMVELFSEAGAVYRWREFNLDTRDFVRDGFELTVSYRAQIAWENADTLWVLVPQPEVNGGIQVSVLLWSRGQAFPAARSVFGNRFAQGTLELRVFESPGKERRIILRHSLSARASAYWQINRDGRVVQMMLPAGAAIMGLYQDEWLALLTAGDWSANGKQWKEWSLLSIPVTDSGELLGRVKSLVEPAAGQVRYPQMAVTAKGVLVVSYENMRPRLWRFTLESGRWVRAAIASPEAGTLHLALTDPTVDLALVTHTHFLQPGTMHVVDVASRRAQRVWAITSDFNHGLYTMERHDAQSKDGTLVPYFVVRARSFEPKGQAPAVIWVYGANGAVETPRYDPVLVRLWLAQGGVYVLANVRGGGELGPGWHVRGAEHQRSFEDTIAVAEDLIRRKITSPPHLGINGHAALGGLLAGVVINMRPDLFSAAVIESATLDLQLQHLIARDYGSWDNPAERMFMEQISPYQNLKRHDRFPALLLIGDSTDDPLSRHVARKYLMKSESYGVAGVFYERLADRSSMDADMRAYAAERAFVFAWLSQRLMPRL